ncbi:unnamed protein product [Penicillium salamii]|nr:unnamed protein product [Penicillium salamii]CAG8201963.1 unnamed protein product [Penicillium salamii]CAG8391855.1 unnamed protein product [Penicillium salamii]
MMTMPDRIPARSRHSARTHINRACESCRHRKTKCNGMHPCQACTSLEKCIYRIGRARKKKTGGSAERLSDVAPKRPAEIEAPKDGSGPVLNDLVQFKRHQAFRVGIGVSNPATGSFQFYGPSSYFYFIQKIYERVKRNSANVVPPQRLTVPEGIEKWGIERFMFSVEASGECRAPQPHEACLPRETGFEFIHAYFKIMHPQMPVLSFSEIIAVWNTLWEPPKPGKCTLKGKELLYMVLAIGARVSSSHGQQSAESLGHWAEHFSTKADHHITMFQEPSLKGTHFMLLKAMYALQGVRPNEAYLYFGYAVRGMLALGINRSQVTEGHNLSMHRLRLTFWTIFANEKMSALFVGRPSCLCEDQIDTPYPEDLLLQDSDTGDLYSGPTSACSWIRAMAEVSKIADRVSIGTYSPTSMRSVSDVTRSEDILIKCDAALKEFGQSLPSYLHFFDPNLPIGQNWEEFQRISLGLNYYLTQMLMHRPTLVFATSFGSTAEAERNSAGLLKIQDSVEASISAARNLINLAYDMYVERYPEIRFDGSWATFLASACITLLYDVLDPRTAPQHASSVFITVERGIRCLDEIEHIGPLTGKAVSMDIMKVAKDAMVSIEQFFEPDQDFVDSFPWLMDNVNVNNDPLSTASGDVSEIPALGVPNILDEQSVLPQGRSETLDHGLNYMPHWLEHGFNVQQIPESLF